MGKHFKGKTHSQTYSVKHIDFSHERACVCVCVVTKHHPDSNGYSLMCLYDFYFRRIIMLLHTLHV